MAKGIAVIIGTEYDGRAVKRAMADIQKAAAQIQGTMGPAMTKVGGQLKTLGSSMSSVGRTMTTHVTLPLTLLGAAAVNTQMKFEQSMNQLQVATDASAQQMQQLSDTAVQMGLSTVYSANDAAAAMLELGKAGFTPAAIAGGAIQSTMALAATEGMNLAEAAQVVSKAMNAFGIAAADTGKVVDMLAAGATATSASVTDLSAGLKYVSSTAASMGVGVQDVVTSLSALNNAGIDGTTAGTSLNRMMLGLIGTTRIGAQTIEQYGLQFFDANGQIKPMVDIVNELQGAFGGLDTATRGVALKRIFGVEGMRAANILIEQGVQGYQKLSEAVGTSGKAQEMADARMSGTAGALERLRGALETLALAFGTVLAPAVQKAADYMTKLAEKFTNLPTSVQTIIAVFAGIAAAIGPVLMLLGPLVSGLGSIVTTIGGMVTAASAGTGVMASLGGSLAALAGPIGIVVAAVAEIVAIFVILYANSQSLRDAISDAWSKISTQVAGAIQYIQGFLKDHEQQISDLQSVLEQLGAFIGATIVPLFGSILSAAIFITVKAFEQAFNIVMGFVQAAKELLNALHDVTNWLGITEGDLFSTTAALDEAATGGGDFATSLDGASGAMETGTSIADSFRGEVDRVTTATLLAKAATDDFATALKGVDAAISNYEAMQGYKQALKDFISEPSTQSAVDAVSAFSRVAASFQDPAEGAAWAATKVDDLRQAIKDAGIVLPPGVKQSIDDLAGSATTALDPVTNLKQQLYDMPRNVPVTITVTTTHGGSTGDLNGNGIPDKFEATGGYITGPGTATSDSIPARLSNGEYVVRSAAVSKFGRSFFDALNKGVFPMSPLAGFASRTATASTGAKPGLSIGSIQVTAAPGERAEESVPRALRRLAFVAGLNG